MKAAVYAHLSHLSRRRARITMSRVVPPPLLTTDIVVVGDDPQKAPVQPLLQFLVQAYRPHARFKFS
jgi:hypothetical protein